MIYLEPEQLKIVANILQEHIPNKKVMVFGSRVSGSIKPFSDLDLCIMGDIALSLIESSNLKEAFSESDLPFRVDIVDWATITPEFREIVMQNVEIFKIF